MDLSRIPAQPKPGLINVLIEIPGGSKNKYEYDKDLQAFALSWHFGRIRIDNVQNSVIPFLQSNQFNRSLPDT